MFKENIYIGKTTKFGNKELEVRLLESGAIQIRPWDSYTLEIINDWEIFETLENYFEFKDNFNLEIRSEEYFREEFHYLDANEYGVTLYTLDEKEYDLSENDLRLLYNLLEKAYYYAD